MSRAWQASTNSRNASSPPSMGSTFMKSLGWYRWFAVDRNTGVRYTQFTPRDWIWSRP